MFESENRKSSNQNRKIEIGIIEATQLTRRIVTALPHSYLVVNSHQKTDHRMRVIGNLLEETNPTVYMPKQHTAKH